RAHGRTEHGGGAGHVRGHVVHAGGRLQRDAAGVEGDPLADQGHRTLRRLGRVLETDQAGRAGRALAHADDAAVAALGELLLVEHRDRHRQIGDELLRTLRERRRVQEGRRGVDQVADDVHHLGEQGGALHGRSRGVGPALGDQAERTECGLRCGGAGAGLVRDERVGAQGGALEGGGALRVRARRQRDGGVLDTAERTGGGAEGEAQILGGDLGEILVTHTDQQQRRRGRQTEGGDAVQLAAVGGRVETGDGLGDLGGPRDARRGAGGTREQGEEEDVGVDVAHCCSGDGDGGHASIVGAGCTWCGRPVQEDRGSVPGLSNVVAGLGGLTALLGLYYALRDLNADLVLLGACALLALAWVVLGLALGLRDLGGGSPEDPITLYGYLLTAVVLVVGAG